MWAWIITAGTWIVKLVNFFPSILALWEKIEKMWKGNTSKEARRERDKARERHNEAEDRWRDRNRKAQAESEHGENNHD